MLTALLDDFEILQRKKAGLRSPRESEDNGIAFRVAYNLRTRNAVPDVY